MAKRWINSADVDISPAGALLVAPGGCTALAGGVKTVAAVATPEPLVATSTPCRFVRFGARNANGLLLNAKVVHVGGADAQHIPISPANFEGDGIAIDDAAKLFVRVESNGDGVWFEILS